jgi:hypothetical protein
VSNTVCVVAEWNNADDAGSRALDSLSMLCSTDGGATFSNGAPVGLGHKPVFPEAAIDKNDRMFVAYYGATGDFEKLDRIYVGLSTNLGATWSILQVNDSAFSVPWHAAAPDPDPDIRGVGDYYAVIPIDSLHVGVLWGDNRRDTGSEEYTMFFSSLQRGTQFLNEFEGKFGYTQIYHPASDSTDTNTVQCFEIRTLTKGTKYVTKPDSIVHSGAFGTSMRAKLFEWNNGGYQNDTNSWYNHPFKAVGAEFQSEEANFKRIYNLTLQNDFEGAGGGSMKWGMDGSSWHTSAAPLTVDTVFGSVFHTYKALADSAHDTLGTFWLFEHWDDTVSQRAHMDIKVSSDTVLTAQFKGHMRTARTDMPYPNQRKHVWAVNRYFMAYESRGNIYLMRGQQTGGVAGAGCWWESEKRINHARGRSINPSITYAPLSGSDSGHIVVVWEDTTWHGDTLYHSPKVSEFNIDGTNTLFDNANLSIWGDAGFASDEDAAPMACPVKPVMGTSIADAVVTWGDRDSVWVAVINSQCPGGDNFARQPVPNSAGGKFAAIEPAWHDDTTGCSDCPNFHLVFQRPFGNTYEYVQMHCSEFPSTVFNFSSLKTVIDSIQLGHPGIPSIAVGPKAEPIISFGFWDARFAISKAGPIAYSFDGILRHGISTVALDTLKGAWGGIRTIQNIGIANGPLGSYSTAIEPSVTIYRDDSLSYRLYWTKRQGDLWDVTASDSIAHGSWPIVPSASFSAAAIADIRAITTAGQRSPHLPYSRWTPSTYHRAIWVKDSAATHILKRGDSCEAPDNEIGPVMVDNPAMFIKYCDSANFEFHVTDIALRNGGGTSTALHCHAVNLSHGIRSVRDAESELRTQYFTLADSTSRITMFLVPMVGDTAKAFGALDSMYPLQIRVEMRDSATDTLITPLSQTTIMRAFPHVSGALSRDTTAILGHSGQTCYLRIVIDTAHLPSSASVTAMEVLSEERLSVVLSPGGGMPKMETFGRMGAVRPVANPIDLSIAPNPTASSSALYYTVPVEDADDVVDVQVFDVTYANVTHLVQGMMAAGKHEIRFDGTMLPSGRYVVAVHTKSHQQSKLLILVK